MKGCNPPKTPCLFAPTNMNGKQGVEKKWEGEVLGKFYGSSGFFLFFKENLKSCGVAFFFSYKNQPNVQVSNFQGA